MYYKYKLCKSWIITQKNTQCKVLLILLIHKLMLYGLFTLSLLKNNLFINHFHQNENKQVYFVRYICVLKLNPDIKHVCNKPTLQFDPYSCLTRVTSCYNWEGHWFWNQVCFPPVRFVNWEPQLPQSAKELIFRLHCLSAYDLCFCFSLCLAFCCPWCCSVVQSDWECISPLSILWV